MDSGDVKRGLRKHENSRNMIPVVAWLTISQYHDDVDVQAECLRVLGNMCLDDENARLAGQRGAIESAVDAMTRHRGH